MTLLLEPAARVSSSPDIFAAMHDPACSLAIWQRDSVSGAEELVREERGEIRFSAPLVELEARLASELNAAGYPDGATLDTLTADVLDLAQRFAAMMELDGVHMRLGIVNTNSCRKFHADYVKARLITAYAGTGTQWIDAADAARVAEGEEPQAIQTLSAGDVGLFKGKMWTQSPAIHRSPPIADTGERRLLLVLDPPLKE
ncbi:MAG: DUF1826 domain-containing protein [Pseudomonadota bacterium]